METPAKRRSAGRTAEAPSSVPPITEMPPPAAPSPTVVNLVSPAPAPGILIVAVAPHVNFNTRRAIQVDLEKSIPGLKVKIVSAAALVHIPG